jgi:YfiH family protein
MLTAGGFAPHRKFRHAFFTRQGGVSRGSYASLNCGLGSSDVPDHVRQNRARAMLQIGLPVQALVTARQVHSARAAVVAEAWTGSERPELDGMATRTSGLALGVLSADCAPVLLADPHAGVIGAAHAGWRGAKGGILEATIAAMESLGAHRGHIEAAVGPCIGRDSYEVTDDFRLGFVRDQPDSARFFWPSKQSRRFQFDLAGYVVQRLRDAGIAALSLLPHDTCAEAELFFSYRRVTLNGGGDYGRQLSAIALAP